MAARLATGYGSKVVVMRLIRRKAVVLLALAALAVVAGCRSGTAPRVGDWVAGDGAYPVRLPDGGIAWLFGDSLIRKSDGNDQLVHNSIVVERRGSGSTTIHGGTADNPADLIPSSNTGAVIWPGAGFVTGDTLHVFAEEIGTGGGGFHSTGRHFEVALALPDLRVTRRSEIYGGEISWGQAVLVRGGDVFVYGNREIDGWTNITYLGRFGLGASDGPWQFWDGGGWQGNPLLAAPLKGPDGSRLVAKFGSVISWADGVAAFTIDPPGATIDVRAAAHPWGPFSAKRSLYRVPEQGTYLPRAYWDRSLLVVAYSVPNSRPSFVRAVLTAPMPGGRGAPTAVRQLDAGPGRR